METAPRGAVASEFEDAKQPQQAKGSKRTQVDFQSDIERQNGQKVNDPEEAEYVGTPRPSNLDAQEILDRKYCHAKGFETTEPQPRRFGKLRRGFDRKRDQGKHDQGLNGNRKPYQVGYRAAR